MILNDFSDLITLFNDETSAKIQTIFSKFPSVFSDFRTLVN